MRMPAELLEHQTMRASALVDRLARRSYYEPEPRARNKASRSVAGPSARSGCENLESDSHDSWWDWIATGFLGVPSTTGRGNKSRPSASANGAAVAPTERSSLLLPTDPARAKDRENARLQADRVWGFPRPLVSSECAFMTSLAAQMLLSNVIDFLPGFVSGVLTGHLSNRLSSEYIAARSLSGIFLMLTGYTVNIAIGAAMDTLCAQAYGAGKLHEMGLFFQTGAMLFTLCFLPVTLLSYFCVDIMVLLGQRRDIAELAQNLVLFALPSLPFSMVNALLCKILQGQNIITPMVYAGLVGNVVHDVLIYVLMFHTSVGYVGSSIASTALVVCYTVTLAAYFFRSHLFQREWPGWQLTNALKIVPEFLRLGVAGLGMAMFEFWAFSAVALFAGMLPLADVAISADSTYSSFRYLCGVLYGTISVAGSVRVGNALGANDPQRAKVAAFLSVGCSVVVTALTSVVMVLARHQYPYAYTNDTEVVGLTSELMLATAPFQVFAGISAAGQGVMRGAGMQRLGARVSFVCYLCLALPIGLTLGYQLGLGLVGLWLGLCAGFVCNGGYCLYWLQRANWAEMAVDAQKRTREPSELSPNDSACLC
ncbi:hypothetical protein P43SY_000251 [Pythium insidiosum]|uniref:Multidrug/Oligosaccharidyl-lipid/Polysaccharide (MOP) Flippase Superfamily n=1 Tax=Pythium insidiosum TaxID=114742 RepID=A0AAD5QB16_PYTIN|nr:hypothetical protein P43SY_000251 [Pythium insidiosum]